MNRQQKLWSIRCDELRRLSDGWNGPDSRAPTDRALHDVEIHLNNLDIIPRDDGGVKVTTGGHVIFEVAP